MNNVIHSEKHHFYLTESLAAPAARRHPKTVRTADIEKRVQDGLSEVRSLVSQTLPKGVETFEVIDGIWVTSPRTTLPVATILRQTLLQVSMARQASEGRHAKTEMICQCLAS